MKTHRGFMLRLRQPNEPSKDRASITTRLVTLGPALVGVRRLIATFAIGVALSGCAVMEPTVTVEPGVAFSLPVGKTAVINGNGTRIRFNEVRNDSRCPADVTCVWAGDAEVVVAISRNGSPDDTRILSFIPPKNETTSGDLRIRLVDLAPVPRQSDGNAPRAYVVQLVVSRT